ncbi:DUF1524 domain-containing protein [Arthrobacter sp. H35-D1]|uniref:GmrSD restriction endonuclease domain-containing protein n=1 Tax=Arthrobacter sp. H35-D1 TaxID=3046202 RepID=UPI0024B8A2F1|nr:DUF1524 domain-containing protein [Arthrobacter sp. H35-D1]MDJ0312119.1 DUF1524 domain-containing protein [Arthrobacter sp. H35-D1]
MNRYPGEISVLSPARSTRSFGATDFIMATVFASVLVATTACGGAPAPEAAPASDLATHTSAPSSPAPTPSPTVAIMAPVDGDDASDADGADLAANAQSPVADKALEVLKTIPVKGRAPKTGYSREEFGPAWSDVDRNGCDTRNDILERDLTAKTFKPGTRDCVVLTGVLSDPYTAGTISFVRGPDSAKVQIDHVVALNDAWQKGAQQLAPDRRKAFANDPLNLLAVDGPSNQRKGAGDAATWLPPNKAYRCEYVARQVAVKADYELWVTQAEHDAMATVLGNCAGVDVPSEQIPPAAEPKQPAVVPPAAPVPAEAADDAAPQPAQPAPPAAPPAPVVQPPATDVFYQNCSAVRAAGAAPIRAGQPGFEPKFDRDGDGVGCE